MQLMMQRYWSVTANPPPPKKNMTEKEINSHYDVQKTCKKVHFILTKVISKPSTSSQSK